MRSPRVHFKKPLVFLLMSLVYRLHELLPRAPIGSTGVAAVAASAVEPWLAGTACRSGL